MRSRKCLLPEAFQEKSYRGGSSCLPSSLRRYLVWRNMMYLISKLSQITIMALIPQRLMASQETVLAQKFLPHSYAVAVRPLVFQWGIPIPLGTPAIGLETLGLLLSGLPFSSFLLTPPRKFPSKQICSHQHTLLSALH